MSSEIFRKKRNKSLIAPELRNPGEVAAEQRREHFATAFRRILKLYVHAIEHSDEFGYSSLATLDKTLRRVNRRDVQDILLDVEAATRAALGNDPELLRKFHDWFLSPELDPDVSAPKLDYDTRKEWTEIEQRCGREFVRRSMYPLSAYFHLPPIKSEVA